MKTKLILIIFLTFFLNSFAQKENIVLISENKSNNKTFIFKIEDESFKYLNDKHKKRHVLFNDVSEEIFSINKLKSFTKQKMKKDRINDNFIQSYFEKYFNLFVFVKNSKCKNEGTLFEVEWILSITDPEID